jgi:hypothetical protein
MNEHPIVGLQAIAEFLVLDISTVKKYSRKWQNEGYLIPRLLRRPPRRIILSYPSLLIDLSKKMRSSK